MIYSLVDYRNNYFISDDPVKILEFYNSFEDREQLIQWMRERPKGVANIFEVEGNKDIIVVIPTADFNGKYAKECRENIFKGFHIIFVESGEFPDPYFNYAHNCNMGIKKAMEYRPKWIIVSNDDVNINSSGTILRDELNKVDNRNVDCVFSKPTSYHSYIDFFSSIRVRYFVRLQFSKDKDLGLLLKKFQVKYISSSKRQRIVDELYQIFYFKRLFRLYQIGSFGIISPHYLDSVKGTLFDEVFINYYEDFDASLNFARFPERIAFIDYSIDDIIGGTIGNGFLRRLRSIASLVYLNTKVNNPRNPWHF